MKLDLQHSDMDVYKRQRSQCSWYRLFPPVLREASTLGTHGAPEGGVHRTQKLHLDLLTLNDYSRVLVLYTGGTIGMRRVDKCGRQPYSYLLDDRGSRSIRIDNSIRILLYNYIRT